MGWEPAGAFKADLRERREEELEVRGSRASVPFRAFEIATFLLERAP